MTVVIAVVRAECRLVITALYPVVRLLVTLVFRGRVVEVDNRLAADIVQAEKAPVHLVTALTVLVLNVSALLIVFVIIVTVVVMGQTLVLMGTTLDIVKALVM